jgi:hypothetical protein
MPWQGIRNMTDDELNALFAYLTSTMPVHYVVPQVQPAVLTMKNYIYRLGKF